MSEDSAEKRSHDAAVRMHALHYAIAMEYLKAGTTFASECIKTTALVGAGGVAGTIALLASSNVWPELNRTLIAAATRTFVLSLCSIIATAFFAYLSQLFFANGAIFAEPHYESPSIRPTRMSAFLSGCGLLFQVAAIVCGLIAFGSIVTAVAYLFRSMP